MSKHLQLSTAMVSLITCIFSNTPQAQFAVTKYGTGALVNNSASGSDNSAFGYYALNKNTTGYRNTGVGSHALLENTTGINNTAVGYYALKHNTTGYLNTAAGSFALVLNTTGSNNTASGNSALYYNTTGSDNTASGSGALYRNNTGSRNTAVGRNGLFGNTTGVDNTASGFQALIYNTTGSWNTASGSVALYANTTGDQNTATGVETMRYNTTGYNNTATGVTALYYNKSGSWNTATGYRALFNNDSASYNTAYGVDGLYNNTRGENNTALGVKALYTNSIGYNNTAVGRDVLFNTTTGFNNTAVGNYALLKNTTGSRNTAIGDSAGAAFNSTYSTFLGYKTSVSKTGLTNITVIGNSASATASNQIRIGNTAVSSIGGKVGWSTLSDGRFKKNIAEDVPGLSFINKLRPVTYTLDIAALDKTTGIAEPAATTEDIEAKAAAAKEKHTGFVAQEVEKAAMQLKYDFGGVDKPKNETDFYGLRYAEFVVPLVKAVQEMGAENQAKEERIAKLEEELVSLKQMLLELKNSKNATASFSSAFLEQNTPNPSSGSTIIRYGIPDGVTSARLMLVNVKGQTLKEVNLSRGTGQVNLSTANLPTGVYNYTLWIDGQQAVTKQMVIAR